ncbi:MAG: efflux RND transporter periplasmic adaptor subunit [Hyphomicrobiaceae bacterium]
MYPSFLRATIGSAFASTALIAGGLDHLIVPVGVATVRAAEPAAARGTAGASTPAGVSSSADKRKSQKWTCPMHPHYIADEFGTCPICGMDLVKLEVSDEGLSTADGGQRTVITVAPEVVQSIGVRVAHAERSELGRRVRSFGTVTENQRLQSEVTARVEGWVEQIAVTAVGDQVKRGDLLFKLYSPQLVISQSDYMRSRDQNDLAQRGVSQLKSFGVQEKALEQIRTSRQPMQLVPFFAEQDGTVSELMLRAGSYVKRGMLLARIQDYSKVWLIVSVAEKDLSHIEKDTRAIASFPNQPGHEVAATVDYIYPTIDPKTRTGQVRLVLDNPDGKIRPGSYADITFEIGTKSRVAVPSEAILKNGDGRFVVVSLGQGRFEPRRVETGLVSGRWTEISRGIKTGESVVVSGQFLLDSESALREAFGKLKRLETPLSLLKPDATQMAMIDHMVDAALYLHEALTDGYAVAPKQLDAAISIRDLLWPRFKDTRLAFVLDDAAAALRQAQSAQAESEVRAALAALAAALRLWVLTGAPDHYRAKKVGLFKETDGSRVWLQMEGRVSNPFGNGPGAPVPWPSDTAARGEVKAEALAQTPVGTSAPATPNSGGAHARH